MQKKTQDAMRRHVLFMVSDPYFVCAQTHDDCFKAVGFVKGGFLSEGGRGC